MIVEQTADFEKDLKYYVKKKKYFKLPETIEKLVDDLENGNLPGDKIPGLKLPENSAAYKVRLENKSANVGKSNGFRIIYYLVVDERIYLLTIYSKKDDERIVTDSEIAEMIDNILND